MAFTAVFLNKAGKEHHRVFNGRKSLVPETAEGVCTELGKTHRDALRKAWDVVRLFEGNPENRLFLAEIDKKNASEYGLVL